MYKRQGAVYSEEDIKKLASILEKKQAEYGTEIYIFSDEPYREIAFNNTEVPYVTKYYNNTIAVSYTHLDVYKRQEYLAKDKDIRIEIETNGSVDIKNVKAIENCPSVTLDYKTPYSGMEKFMLTDNYKYLDENDTIKFVCGSIEDLEKTKYIIDTYSLKNRCHLYISPVFGTIELPKRCV